MKLRWIIVFSMFMFFAIADDKFGNCKYMYFKNTKKISTQICYDKDNRFGLTQAFNQKGEVIFENHIRKIAGSASAHYEYYPSGAVKKIDFHDSPDAGIQFYNETITFDENGKQTYRNVHKYPDELFTTVPQEFVKPPKNDTIKVLPKEIAVCQAVIQNQVWVKNETKKNIILIVSSNKHPTDFEHFTLKYKSTKLVFTYRDVQGYANPTNNISFKLFTPQLKKCDSLYNIKIDDEYITNDKTGVRKYFYSINKK